MGSGAVRSGGDRLCQTRLIPRSPDGDNNGCDDDDDDDDVDDEDDCGHNGRQGAHNAVACIFS